MVTKSTSLNLCLAASFAYSTQFANSIKLQSDYAQTFGLDQSQFRTQSTKSDTFDGCSYFQFGPESSSSATSPPAWFAATIGPRTSTFQFTVSMSTTDSDGLLFASVANQLYSVEQGFVIMEIVQGGKVRAALASNTPVCGIHSVTSTVLVNDGLTHTITLDRHTAVSDSFDLVIDGITESTTASGCSNIELDVMWVGGLPASLSPRAGLGSSESTMQTAVTSTSNFAGVIYSVTYASPRTAAATDILPTTSSIVSVGNGCTIESVSTASPTPSPTASTPSPGVAATGDPHLQNVLGQRFDLMKPGKHVLINIPRGRSAQDALLRVQADAIRLGGHCADMYFQSLNVTGSWAEAKQAGGYHYSVSQLDVGSPQWVAFGKLELKVVCGRTESGLLYLNLHVKHLGRTGFAIGGLLGEDDHKDVMTPPASCTKRTSLTAGRLSRADAVASLA
ncbi:unnamed protein product [Prorocentrum cordatum]|uniref:Laminin G domain-containing protein n=2 Tax=Prorocentrum cordatum TaxID=2364126 RepID=A0ABN9RJI5_9DINO|nr:unnamed protein product [Polarella glacialis]